VEEQTEEKGGQVMDVHQAISTIDRDDHGIFEPKVVKEICEALGVKPPRMHTIVADTPDTFKGVTLFDGDGKPQPPGTEADGYGSMELAKYLCNILGLTYPFKSGRGSQCGACCTVLFKHFVKAVK
jgi:hypothetical protein